MRLWGKYPAFLKTRRAMKRLQREYPGRELLTSRIGAGAQIGIGCYIGPEAEVGANTQLGDYSYLNRGTLFQSGEIGKFCSIGYYCQIGMYQHPLCYVSTSSRIYGQWSIFQHKPDTEEFSEFTHPPRIGHDVWLGSNAHVLQGVEVGTGAVIGAGAVVTKNIDPYTIAVGVPARPIGKRFDDEAIALLLEWRWWNMSAEELAGWRDVLTARNWKQLLKRRLKS